MDGLDHMTEAQCRAYMDLNKLKAHKPFAGSWAGDCRKCMRSGTMVAYNKHPSPTCKSSWLTVCGGNGGESSLQSLVVMWSIVSQSPENISLLVSYFKPK